MFKITELVLKKKNVEEHVSSKSSRKMKFLRFLKFYLIPGWRDPEFSAQEHEIEKIKSKRRLFRHLNKPLTITGLIMILFIFVLAIFTPWLTSYTLQELIVPYVPPSPVPFAPSEGIYVLLIAVAFLILILWSVYRILINYFREKRKQESYFIWISRLVNFAALLSLIIICVIWISLLPLDPNKHPFGTTKYGYDVIARLIWGARTTILTSLIPVTISIGGGLILGTISAYFGGVIDYLMMRFVDLFYAFPTLVLVIIFTPMFGQDLLTILVIYGILFIPYNIRFMRSLVFQVKQLEYIQAAKVGGSLKFNVMFKHIIPNAISPMLISFFGGAAIAIIGLAGLAFIGFSDPTVASWGLDIFWAQGRFSNVGASVWPGLCIGITAIGYILVGDGLRDALDPRLKL